MAIYEFHSNFPDLNEKARVTQIQRRHGGEEAVEAYDFWIRGVVSPTAGDSLRFLIRLPLGELWAIRRISLGTENEKFYDAFPLVRSRHYQIYSDTGAVSLLESDLEIGAHKSYSGGTPVGVSYEREELYQTDLSEGEEIGFEVKSRDGSSINYGNFIIHTVRTLTLERLRAKMDTDRLSVRRMWERLWSGTLTRRR